MGRGRNIVGRSGRFAVLEDMEHCRKISKHFSSSTVEERDLLVPSTRPKWLMFLYTAAGSPVSDKPGDLHQPPYLCIPLKTDVNCKYFNVETETKRVSSVGNELILFIS